jgi:hypothetical protein
MRFRASLAVALCGVALLLSSDRLEAASTDSRPCPGDPTTLGAALNAVDAEQRRQAAIGLRDCTPLPDEMLQALVLALDDSSSAVAANAAEALIPVGARAVPPLVERVRTRNGEDRALAIRSLGRMGQAGLPAVSALLDELRNRRLDHGAALVLAIRDLGGDDARAAVPLFVKLFDDPEIRDEAASAVARLSGSYPDRVIPILVQAFRKQSRDACPHGTADADLARYGELAIPTWVELLSDRSIPPFSSLRALDALGPKALNKAIPFLRSILDKPEWGWARLEATRYLLDRGAIERDAAAAVYESFLSHEHERWRLDAVAGLIRIGRIADPQIKDFLNALVDDRQEDVRERARALLAKLGE